MKYTAEQLGAMPELELNKALAVLLNEYINPPDNLVAEDLGGSLHYRNNYGSYIKCHPNYCADTERTVNLAFDHRLRVSPYMDIWVVDFTATGVSCYHTDPLRAIVIVLILVLQERDA